MADDDRKSSFARSSKSLQENVTRSGPAMAASYTLVGGIILLGGIGYGVDRWRGTSPWFLLAGLGLGIVICLWRLARRRTLGELGLLASAEKP